MYAPRTPPRKRRGDEFADSPSPFFTPSPRGVRRREPYINTQKLRAEMSATPPPRPTTPPSYAITPPRIPPGFLRQKNPEDVCFIKRKPSTPAIREEDGARYKRRHVSTPERYRSRPARIELLCNSISGPATDIVYTRVKQMLLLPEDMNPHTCPTYPPEDNVDLGNDLKNGCSFTLRDCVNFRPLNIDRDLIRINIGFQWQGYGEPLGRVERLGRRLGRYENKIDLLDCRRDPVAARIKILKRIESLFRKFTEDFRIALASGTMKAPEDNINVLNFDESGIRVTQLERRSVDYYQVVFKYPVRQRR